MDNTQVKFLTTFITSCNFDVKVPLVLLCRIISVECPTNFEFGATFSIVVYALNLFWFEFDLVLYIRQ